MTPAEILALPMDENDSGATTIRGYLKALLRELWNKGEGFGGKRPFGNSGWQHDLYAALVKGGAVEGTLDEDDYLDTIDDQAADSLIIGAIDAL